MMNKTIVTHFNPDTDAIAAVWLVKRFLRGWKEATVKFTPPGKHTIDNKPVDSDADVLYLDTGLGKFDHHQSNKFTCSAILVWKHIKKVAKRKDEAVERLIKIVNEIDHARDITWPEADNDRYEFSLHLISEGIKRISHQDPSEEVLDFGLRALDGVYKMFQEKIRAEEELEKGREFQTPWGKAMALETKVDSAIFLGEKKGYVLVAKLDSKLGRLMIFGHPDKKVDLTEAFREFKKRDPKPNWFLHSSKAVLMNGTLSQPEYKPTKLSLEEIIGILRKS